MDKKNALKSSAAIALIAVAIFLLARGLFSRSTSSEDGAQVWFYNEGAKKLYAMPRDSVPPDEKSRGVRAMVVTFRGQGNKERKIAYLQSYSPDLKKMLEAAGAAHRASQPYTGKIPAQGSAWFQDSTLVKRVTDSGWSTAGSDEGRQILAEWKTWRGPDGDEPIISTP